MQLSIYEFRENRQTTGLLSLRDFVKIRISVYNESL
jgi:hypothetical protein